MIETTVKISGMMCGMCEAHINSAIRNAFPVKKVAASRSKGQAVIYSEQPLDAARLCAVIRDTGYDPGDVSSAPCERRGPLGRLFRK